jgi:hypothetical protein
MKDLPLEEGPQYGRYETGRIVLCDFTIEHDKAEHARRVSMNQTSSTYLDVFEIIETDATFKEVVACLPEEKRNIRQLRDRPPLSEPVVGAFDLGTLADLLAVLGLPGLFALGRNALKWFQEKKGRSGPSTTLIPVALWHIAEREPNSRPDPTRVECANQSPDAYFAEDYQEVYLYRVYDQNGERVYIVEVDSRGDLLSFSARAVSMFEVGPNSRPQ